MENNSRKAFETAYGASVISAQPVVGPPIMSGPTMPGTGQLCGPCKTGGYCPVHNGGGAGAPKVLVEGEPRVASPTEKLGVIVTNFLDDLVEHLADRVAAKMRAQFEPVEAHEPESFESQMAPFVALRLRELQVALAEHGIAAIMATDEHTPSGLMVARPAAPAMYLYVTTDDGMMFTLWRAGGPLHYPLEGVVDFFVTVRESGVTDVSAES